MSTFTSSVQETYHPSSTPTAMYALLRPFPSTPIETIAAFSTVGTHSCLPIQNAIKHAVFLRPSYRQSFQGHLTQGPSGYVSVGYNEEAKRRGTRHNTVFPSFDVERLVFAMDDLWKQYAILIPPRRSSGNVTDDKTAASSVPGHIHRPLLPTILVS
ncbi:hypothetical protein BKA70DRAFT_737569 [Coprinopsis sp. MPI-PUGE-AT-0042]|nr:hypothetical protein BKA70DRAFT_737569 [Coprinopsis sp. MPI-PUGE-AT-0042]